MRKIYNCLTTICYSLVLYTCYIHTIQLIRWYFGLALDMSVIVCVCGVSACVYGHVCLVPFYVCVCVCVYVSVLFEFVFVFVYL